MYVYWIFYAWPNFHQADRVVKVEEPLAEKHVEELREAVAMFHKLSSPRDVVFTGVFRLADDK